MNLRNKIKATPILQLLTDPEIRALDRILDEVMQNYLKAERLQIEQRRADILRALQDIDRAVFNAHGRVIKRAQDESLISYISRCFSIARFDKENGIIRDENGGFLEKKTHKITDGMRRVFRNKYSVKTPELHCATHTEKGDWCCPEKPVVVVERNGMQFLLCNRCFETYKAQNSDHKKKVDFFRAKF